MPLFNTVPGSVAPKATYAVTTTTENPILSINLTDTASNIVPCSNNTFLARSGGIGSGGAIAQYGMSGGQLEENINFPPISHGQIAYDSINSVNYWINGSDIIIYSESAGFDSIGSGYYPGSPPAWIMVNPYSSLVTLQTSDGIYQYDGELTSTMSESNWTQLSTANFVDATIAENGLLQQAGSNPFCIDQGHLRPIPLNTQFSSFCYDAFDDCYCFSIADGSLLTYSISDDTVQIVNNSIPVFNDMYYEDSTGYIWGINAVTGIYYVNPLNNFEYNKLETNHYGNLICGDNHSNFLIKDDAVSENTLTYFTYPLSTITTTKTLVPALEKITSSAGNSYKYKGSTLYISNNTNILDYSATVDDILGGE